MELYELTNYELKQLQREMNNRADMYVGGKLGMYFRLEAVNVGNFLIAERFNNDILKYSSFIESFIYKPE